MKTFRALFLHMRNLCHALRMQTCRQQAVGRMALCLPLKAGHTLPTSVEKELHLGKAAVAAKKAVLMRKRPFAVSPTKDHLVRSTACLVCRDSRSPLIQLMIKILAWIFVSKFNELNLGWPHFLVGFIFWLVTYFVWPVLPFLGALQLLFPCIAKQNIFHDRVGQWFPICLTLIKSGGPAFLFCTAWRWSERIEDLREETGEVAVP